MSSPLLLSLANSHTESLMYSRSIRQLGNQSSFESSTTGSRKILTVPNRRNSNNQLRLMKAPRKRRSSQGFVKVTCLEDKTELRESANKVRDVKEAKGVKRAAGAT